MTLTETLPRVEPVAVPGLWAPMRHRNMRRFMFAAGISNLGSWAQSVAIPFAVYELTKSASWLGTTAFAGTMLSMACNTPGGWAADRFPRRLVLLVTTVFQIVAAMGLWALWRFGDPTIGWIVPFLLVNSMGAGLLMPAWQSIVPALAEPDELPSAIRLNSLQFAISRSLGPALGALLLKRFGASVCFLFNALTFVAMIVMLLGLDVGDRRTGRAEVPSAHLLDERSSKKRSVGGWTFMLSSWQMIYPLLANFMSAAFGFGLITLAPALVSELFGRDSDEGGLLIAAFGIGGVVALIVVASLLQRHPRSMHMKVALLSWCVSAVVLVATGSFTVGLIAAVCAGAANTLSGITLNTSLQTKLPDEIRGRAMAVYMQVWFLGNALGSLILGAVADSFGIRAAPLLTAGLFLAFVMWSLLPTDRMRHLD